jgi:rhamnogalacturonyl hydrolase YesR
MRTIATQSVKEAKIMATNKQHDAQMRMVLYPGALDDCGAMVAAYCSAYISADSKERKSYEPVIERYIDFVLNKQYRMNDGTFARKRPHFNTVWLDDMYMGVPAMAWYARYLKEKGETTRSQEIAAKALEQIRLFQDKMWVPEKKLFRHGWVEAMQPHPAFFWGRANGWAILTLCEVLDVLPADHPKRPMILSLLRQHIAGLARRQHHDGFWHQLLDRDDTYLEASATAIYTYGIAHAINKGWVDAKAYGPTALLGWQAVNQSVNEKGQVENVCVGTGMGFDAAFYAYRPVHVMAAHGYGPAIWAGAEIILLLQHQHPKMNDSAVHFYDEEVPTNEPIFNYDGKIRY